MKKEKKEVEEQDKDGERYQFQHVITTAKKDISNQIVIYSKWQMKNPNKIKRRRRHVSNRKLIILLIHKSRQYI